MKKTLALVLVAAMMLVAFAGCTATPEAEKPADDGVLAGPGAQTEQVEAQTPEEDLKLIKIGLAMNSKQAPAFHAWADYLKMRVDIEAAERGYKVEYTELNAENDVTKQANDINDLLAKDCDIIFCPCLDSKAILPSVEAVHDAGKIYVSYCREVSKEATGKQVPDITVNFSSEEQAYVGVMRMFEIMAADGVVPVKMIDVFGDTTDENSHNREAGMQRALKDAGYADLPIVTVDCGRWEPDVALQNIEPVLAANPDANCMYVSSDFLMTGVQTGLENAGMWFPRGEEGHIYTNTSDMFPIGIDLLREGYIDTAVDQGCYNFAVYAAKSAFDLFEGKEVEAYQLVLGTMATNEVGAEDNIETILATIPLWGNDYRD